MRRRPARASGKHASVKCPRRRAACPASSADNMPRQSPVHQGLTIDGRRYRENRDGKIRVLAVWRLARRSAPTHPSRRAMPDLPGGSPRLPAMPPLRPEGSRRVRPRPCRPRGRQGERELLHVLSTGTRRLARGRRGTRSSREERADAALRSCRRAAVASGQGSCEVRREGPSRARRLVRDRIRSRSRLRIHRRRSERARTLTADVPA